MKLENDLTTDALTTLTRVFGVFNINVALDNRTVVDDIALDLAFKVEGKGREYLILSERRSRGFSAYRANNGKVSFLTSSGSPKSIHRMLRECVTAILADFVDDQW
jgi:hypothetical protein